MKCPFCRKEVPDGTKKCPKCFAAIPAAETKPIKQDKKKVTGGKKNA